MTEYHIFGDTGGHLNQLRSGLQAIGLNLDTMRLPQHTVVIHCGDLIHKGPHSQGVLELVDAVMEANPGAWVQLLGNHEFQYLRGAPTFWPQVVSVEGQLILQSWLAKRRLRVAYAVQGPLVLHSLDHLSTAVDMDSRGALFTHSGLPYEFWREHLGAESSVQAVAEAINGLPISTVTTPGEMLGGFQRGADEPVGPVWASGVNEVWGSWLDREPMPFIQFHGHTTPYSYSYGKWWESSPQLFRKSATVSREGRFTAVRVAGSLQFMVDPGYSVNAPPGAQPSFWLRD